MARARKVCKRAGCPQPASATGRGECKGHAAETARRRGSGWTRYGRGHRAKREAEVGRVDAGALVVCWRCGLPIWPGQQTHLGHLPGREVRDGYTGPGEALEHASCGAAGRMPDSDGGG